MSLPFARDELAAIVREAGAILRAAFGRSLTSTLKSDGSPVTEVDRAIDAMLRSELSRLLPEAAWLSEETADDPSRLDRSFCWIVDPVDGTKQLLRAIPELAVSVALVRDGAPVAAAILNPITSEEGVWTEGSAPTFAGLAARNAATDPDTVEAIVSRTEAESGELRPLTGVVGTLRPVGSVAYKLLRVAARADVVTFSMRPKSEWDIAGGAALVQAAGGVYLRLDGLPLRFNQAVPEIPSGAVAGRLPLARILADRLAAR